MTSTCNNAWLTAIAAREWHAGFADGLIVGLVIAGLLVACAVAYALTETGGPCRRAECAACSDARRGR